MSCSFLQFWDEGYYFVVITIIVIMLFGDLRLTDEQLKAYALAELEMLLQSAGKSLSDFPPMPKVDASLVPDIAALLMSGGRTAHSRFGIPFIIDETSTCGVIPNTPLVSLVIKAKLIIWDEAPMMHKHCFEALDRSLRDVLKTVDERNKDIPFGGKVVVLGGDFRQILLVMPKATRLEIVYALINSSNLWRYCEVLTLTKNTRVLSGASEADIEERELFSNWVLRVGDGTTGEINDVNVSVEIPSDLLIPSSGNPIASIVEST
ncbi:PIF1-like helicase [Medicago truncatula]|uniref:ATP-dependent DNA helicase n=1 Tax=Medicago truncatula TaxID=3880 RepID=A0A072VIR6_MEDTR|nr:PIF1-like helicase [Medicago truncatula]